MPRRAIYPGSFDPLTNGHLSIIHRALRLVDELVVAVVGNPKKAPLFPVDERKALIRGAIEASAPELASRVEIDHFEGLLVDYRAKKGIPTILRGLRAVSDFEYEFQMANMNRKLDAEFDTIFMMTGEDYYFISSQLVREVAALGGDVRGLVPPNVFAALAARFPLLLRHK